MGHPTIIYQPLSYGERSMSSSNDEDSQQRFALGFLTVLLVLLVAFVIGIALWHNGRAAAAKTEAPAAVGNPAALAVVAETATIPDGASIRINEGVVSFYFATGSADLAPGAAEALATVIKGVQDGRKAVVSGFHDTTGDAASNEQLARKRAEMVRDVLVGLGVAADKVDLQKPVVTIGSGNDAEARRVEVKLVD
jgi:outer membrane protein OmpA-like peptidoglycan-associated protein